MSLVNRPAKPPLLVDGQRLDQREFHKRYEAMPPGTWAELIGGVVYMSSPVSLAHGRRTGPLIAWLLRYESSTLGVEAVDNVSTALDDQGEPQSDASLRVREEYGGQTRDEAGILIGAPEFVAEVAVSSRSVDLGAKLRDYERTGVREYLVVTMEPDEIHWHVRRDDRLVHVGPDTDGLYRSHAFPGLWLSPEALLDRDLARLFQTLDSGIATAEHADFVRRLAEKGSG